MATINELKKYLGYEFSSGPYTGQDYRTFQTKYVNYLRGLCKANGWELARVGRNHYCFSAFIKDSRNKYVYLSVSDVRYFRNEWYRNILVRTAASDRDYHGGRNDYTALPEMQAAVEKLLTGDATL
jgi:hypothetical protein